VRKALARALGKTKLVDVDAKTTAIDLAAGI
jgi:hypothetical protein